MAVINHVIPELSRRALPSFEQWLNENGDGSRGDGFDAFVNLAERTHSAKPENLTDEQATFLRLWMGLQVAIIELCNLEDQRGVKPETIITMMPRVLATAGVYAVASVAKDDAPMRTMAKILIKEFRFAAKEAADQIEAKR